MHLPCLVRTIEQSDLLYSGLLKKSAKFTFMSSFRCTGFCKPVTTKNFQLILSTWNTNGIEKHGLETKSENQFETTLSLLAINAK